MRVLIATPLYPPEPGGPATYTKLLEERLPALGIDVTVVKFSDVRHLPKAISHGVYAWKVFRAGRQANVVLALDALSVGWPTLFANIFLRKKFVVKMVGDHIWEQGRQRFGVEGTLDESRMFTTHPYLVFLRILQQLTMRAADHIIVPSHYLKNVVTSWGIRDTKIDVIYNSIELGVPGKLPASVASAPRPKVVCVGRLVPWKHVDGIIDAVAGLEDATLIVVGDGPDSERLRTYANERLNGRVVFTGAIPHEDSLAVLKDSDVLALNSSYEGLSHVLIEALISGLPIVATDAGGNSEVITEGSGILVPAGDTDVLRNTLRKLLDDDGLRHSLSNGARERAKTFTVPVMLERTKELIATVI